MTIKRAKIITDVQFPILIRKAKTSDHPLRDEAAIRLSYGAGLRGGEIARVRWANNLLDARGNVMDAIHITSDVGKRSGERVVPLSEETKKSLVRLRKARPEDIYLFYALHDRHAPRIPVLDSKGKPKLNPKGKPLTEVDPAWEGNVTPNASIQWFRRFFKEAGFAGCTSHSGRRSFITDLARIANTKGCSLVDVQEFAGHKRLETTAGYIEPSENQVSLVAGR